jgi:hypothetical protein
VSERWPGEPAEVEELDDEEEEEELDDDDLPPAAEEDEELPRLRTAEQQHAYGELDIPDDVNVLEGSPDGTRRGVAIVASRFNGDITNQLLEAALEELDEAGVRREAITVMPVPGAFELPLAAMALAKTRRSVASSAGRRRTSTSSPPKRRAGYSSRRWRRECRLLSAC